MIFLITWSIVAFAWWIIALILLAKAGRTQSDEPSANALNAKAPHNRPTVTIFKPLPPIRDERERAAITEAVASFVGQLSPRDELIVGLNIEDEQAWRAGIQSWRGSAPNARIRVIARVVPVQRANPKIGWLEVLSADANGELWLWSDADVSAPQGFLESVCGRLSKGDVNAVTAPYCVRNIEEAKQVLDAAYVNLEFLPGALLLDLLKLHRFAYGAATMFRAATFRQRADWTQLGNALADDYKLGQLLQSVALGRVMVSTFTRPKTWLAAWQHYYRWQKTVRWCQPAGYASLLVLMPLLGWSFAGLCGAQPGAQVAGLGGVILGEMLVAFMACRLVGCRLPFRSWFGVVLWPFTRPVVWLLVWLPLPVLWSGHKREWFAPEAK